MIPPLILIKMDRQSRQPGWGRNERWNANIQPHKCVRKPAALNLFIRDQKLGGVSESRMEASALEGNSHTRKRKEPGLKAAVFRSADFGGLSPGVTLAAEERRRKQGEVLGAGFQPDTRVQRSWSGACGALCRLAAPSSHVACQPIAIPPLNHPKYLPPASGVDMLSRGECVMKGQGGQLGETSTSHQPATIAGRRSSVSYGGDDGGWCEPPPGACPREMGPAELAMKQEAYLPPGPLYDLGYVDGLEQRPARKSLPLELGGLYRRLSAPSGSLLPPQDYYQLDLGPPGQLPQELPGVYRAEQHLLSRSVPHYGIAGGGRPTWDQGHGRTAPPLLPPPAAPPSAQELSRLYRNPVVIGKMISDRLRSGDPVAVRYGAEPPFASRPLYSDVNGRSLDPHQTAAGLAETPSAYGMMAAPRLAYDPAYDTATGLTVAPVAPTTTGLAQHHVPQPAATTLDPKRVGDPEFLAMVRAEGLSESTIALLLQQGFDSPSMLAMMEEHDIRSVAPNLGQARVLSRLTNSCRMEQQTGLGTHPRAMRTRSNSFTHRNDHYLQQPNLPAVDPHLLQQPAAAMSSISPRMGEVMGRRPSSAPSQHLLETAAYPAARVPGGFSMGTEGYGNAMTPARPVSTFNAHTGLAMSAMPLSQQQPPPASTTPGSAPKTFSTNYTVPMELMKRAPSLPPVSPMHSPLHSPQLLRKGAVQADTALLPAVAVSNAIAAAASASAGTLQAQNPNAPKTRRTGPPVIVSTMASPDTSNVPRLYSPHPSVAHVSVCKATA
ncbi:hypothetical protein Z043_116658 [Scleropages formosus]|uniref:Uncharacterized protein n=1 Tax=Scleropages formosus TaxID=113540 RepID=A0A0N8JXX5_SCLFO|nr:hypothetical protein Z043_116658 [Scleropages formosus]